MCVYVFCVKIKTVLQMETGFHPRSTKNFSSSENHLYTVTLKNLENKTLI